MTKGVMGGPTVALVVYRKVVWAVMENWPRGLLPKVVSQMLKLRIVMHNVQVVGGQSRSNHDVFMHPIW